MDEHADFGSGTMVWEAINDGERIKESTLLSFMLSMEILETRTPT